MTDTVADKINRLFERLIEGDLQTSGPSFESGWETELPSGKPVARSTLQAEAQTAIALGMDAIPYLVRHVKNGNSAVRYVAIYALEQITGEKSGIPYAGSKVANPGLDQAIETWLKWYESHKGS